MHYIPFPFPFPLLSLAPDEHTEGGTAVAARYTRHHGRSCKGVFRRFLELRGLIFVMTKA